MTISTQVDLAMLHQSVLLNEAVEALNIRADGIYLDGTFGRGGHSRVILQQLGANGRLIGFDQDPEAVAVGAELAKNDARFQMVHSPFEQMQNYVTSQQLLRKIDGILLDLGVSSPQLNVAERGFSFMRDGELDMRMDTSQGEPISEWLAKAKMEQIAEVLKEFGEERYAKRLSRAIVEARQQTPITRTKQLAEIISEAHPAWEKDKHPATRSFQALRIFVNRELEQLENILPQILKCLAPQGRIAIISFHSLEDRLVKRFFRDEAKGDNFPKGLPITVDQLTPTLKLIGKAISPSEEEVTHNPRARSAVLRVAEKL